jgi:hypothetical protein
MMKFAAPNTVPISIGIARPVCKFVAKYARTGAHSKPQRGRFCPNP